MNYSGENLLPGQIGQFLIVLSFFASLVASFAYFRSARLGQFPLIDEWKKLARWAFVVEAASVFIIFGLIYYINSNHLFEYKYAWQHSSRSLESKYLLAGIWEGQEGSFLLWSIWHSVLGLIVLWRGGKWEAPVMSIVSFAQVVIGGMLLGIYIGDVQIGSNPFILLRDSGVFDNAPAMHVDFDLSAPIIPDYLNNIRDGNDLNPLLQNYWMVIHPPVLFLGFAATLFPFAYAVAGLWKPAMGNWTAPALPWSLFALASLGVGIMMGAAWAYESLTFGGYWAWDPVENASLVPWLILVAGIHTLLIYKHTGQSLRATSILLILQFFFILYSTFLTRSGILGESSVHSFTDLGMNKQLYLMLFVFTWPVALLIAKDSARSKRLALVGGGMLLLTTVVASTGFKFGEFSPAPLLAFGTIITGIVAIIAQVFSNIAGDEKEESSSSREFWMFIGSLIFFFSAIVITVITSLPVLNKLVDLKMAAQKDQELLYNRIHVFVAIIIGVLTAFTQYLRYKNTPGKIVWKKLLIPTIIGLAAGIALVAFGNIDYNKEGPGFLGAIWLAVIATTYAIVANGTYIWTGIKGKLSLSGGSVAHVGFGMVLLGILLSSSKKEILSYNTSGIPINFGEQSTEKTGENLTLVKGRTTPMGKYDVTYIGDSAHPRKEQWYYQIHFKSRLDEEEFTLWPNAFVNYKGNEGLMANPDSRHYLGHDVFTYVSALPNPDKMKDTSSFTNYNRKVGDSIFYSKGFVIVESLEVIDSLPVAGFEQGDSAAVARLRVYSANKNSYPSQPVMVSKQGTPISLPDTVMSEALILRLDKIYPDGRADIGMKESDAVLQWITLKAYRFPMINLLWLGILITAVGILISMVHRIQVQRRNRTSTR
ncbi:MAG: cytochrome c biogenesis protein CcsA [Chitinophagaceae bacterium]